MNGWILRCWRVAKSAPRVGKHARRAMRHHWHIGHVEARVLWHGSQLVCAFGAIGAAVLRFAPALPAANALPVDVPEPSTAGLVSAAVVALWVGRRLP